jgi:hypothetical protein
MIISGTTLNNSPVTVDITYLADPIIPVLYELAGFSAGGMTLVDSSGNRNNGIIHSSLDHEGLSFDTAYQGGIVLSGTQWIDSPYVLSQDFTVTMAVMFDINVNNFPASLWGSEVWDLDTGYVATFIDSTTVSFGIAGALNGFPNSNTSTVEATFDRSGLPTIFDFVKLGTQFSIYINGQIAATQDFGQEGSLSTAPMSFGSRHQNDGTYGIADPMVGSIYYIKVRNYGITIPEANLIFQSLKSRYGL